MHEVKNAFPRDRLKRFLVRAFSLRMLSFLAMGVLLAVIIIVAGHDIERHISAIESWISSLGPWGMLAFIGAFVLATSVLLPESVFVIIAGALFGVIWGLVVVLTGSLVASALQFLVSRHLLRAQIQRVLESKPALAAIQRAVNRGGYRLQVLLRLTPLNPAVISYLLGAAGVRFFTFLLACFALIPNLLIEVYLGQAGVHIARVAGGASRTMSLHDLVPLGSFLVCVIVVVRLSRMAHRAVLEAAAETDDPQERR